MKDNNEYWLHPDTVSVILDALSRGIIQYETKDPYILHDYIRVYEQIHALVDQRYPGWKITNDTVKAIIAKQLNGR